MENNMINDKEEKLNEKEIQDKSSSETNKEQKNDEKETKKKKKNIKIKTKNYTEDELMNLIRNKYRNHNQYFKVLQNIVDTIIKNETSELDNAMKSLEKLVVNSKNLSMNELQKYVIQIPIFMYKLNEKVASQALNMEISNHLNNYEVTETLLRIDGGTASERLKIAEYETMISTFTLLVKTRVYYNLKSNLDYSSKVYDGLKKVLSAQIEELKIFGKDTGNR